MLYLSQLHPYSLAWNPPLPISSERNSSTLHREDDPSNFPCWMRLFWQDKPRLQGLRPTTSCLVSAALMFSSAWVFMSSSVILPPYKYKIHQDWDQPCCTKSSARVEKHCCVMNQWARKVLTDNVLSFFLYYFWTAAPPPQTQYLQIPRSWTCLKWSLSMGFLEWRVGGVVGLTCFRWNLMTRVQSTKESLFFECNS